MIAKLSALWNRGDKVKEVKINKTAKKAAQQKQELEQARYLQILCHVETMFEHDQNLPDIIPFLQTRFKDILQAPQIANLLERDEIFADLEWSGYNPNERKVKSLTDLHPDIMMAFRIVGAKKDKDKNKDKRARTKTTGGPITSSNRSLVDESPYLADILLYAASRLPDIVTSPNRMDILHQEILKLMDAVYKNADDSVLLNEGKNRAQGVKPAHA